MKEIMILGIFHLKNRKRDLVNGEYQVNEEDIEMLVNKLIHFKPTKIAVEYSRVSSENLHTDYKKYRNSEFELSENEVHQIAFRLGKILELEKLYCVDWNEKVSNTLTMTEVFEQIKMSEKSYLVDNFFNDAKMITEKIEELNNDYSILEALKYLNTEDAIDKFSWLNHRLVEFNLNEKYIGNKWLQGWYVRNLNIVSNILDITNDSERVLVIYGNSHTKLLREMLSQNPYIRLIDPLKFL